MGMSNNDRQKAFQRKQREAGLVPVNLWVPEGAMQSLKELAEVLRARPHLEAGTLRDPHSGKLVGLKGELKRIRIERAAAERAYAETVGATMGETLRMGPGEAAVVISAGGERLS